MALRFFTTLMIVAVCATAVFTVATNARIQPVDYSTLDSRALADTPVSVRPGGDVGAD